MDEEKENRIAALEENVVKLLSKLDQHSTMFETLVTFTNDAFDRFERMLVKFNTDSNQDEEEDEDLEDEDWEASDSNGIGSEAEEMEDEDWEASGSNGIGSEAGHSLSDYEK